MTAHGCALYIGCGTDFDPVADLQSTVSRFIYVDSQPLTECGDLYQACTPQEKMWTYRKTYMRDFAGAAESAGFQKISLDGVYPHVYKNSTTNQEVYHYFSLCFPIQSFKQNHAASKEELTRLVFLLSSVTHLVVRKYVPNINIFRYFLRPIVFVGYDDTIYVETLSALLPYERNKITAHLQQGQYRDRFSKYIYASTVQKREQIYASTYNEFVSNFIQSSIL
jgi:hypothetical protein